MAVIEVRCTECSGERVVKYGKTDTGEQRYFCRMSDCRKAFQLRHRYKAYEQGVKERIVDMALNGSKKTKFVMDKILHPLDEAICTDSLH